MPRILPRLINVINKEANEPKHYPFRLRPRPKSLHKPVPSRPSFVPADHLRSILLESENPVTISNKYVQHKSLPPRPILPTRAAVRKDEYDQPRAMSDEERSWWSSPYLRMLASPIRQCIATGRYLPTDFLIRLGPMRLPLPPGSDPSAMPKTTLIPDGLQHVKFTSRKARRAVYVMCLREALPYMINQKKDKRAAHFMTTHPRLAEHAGHLLRLRVLQDLEVHGDQLGYALHATKKDAKYQPTVRRMTRQERATFQETGLIPFENAIAVIVAPPPANDPMAGTPPQPDMSALPPPPGSERPSPLPELPLTTFHATSPTTNTPCKPSLPDILPAAKVPLYNGESMFPNLGQRAALHAHLTRILGIESQRRKLYGKVHLFPVAEDNLDSLNGNDESDAFLLCSGDATAKYGDVTAVAISLWRVRMFEGGGWDQKPDWVLNPGQGI
ncbi:hypothetical protein BDQ12DRAFT_674864 [Crucibulum laeve]|uniref:Uncharacterized protein n=1 Tax=Crucibulum laeve TaxID=68775 RepID=A0A5C3MDA3_9AGAR|nr:hypothetical protein BDQ12DRAFT_674864 [Crucibulum laeve]